MSTKKQNSYKDTIHLPKTSFPMKANLPQREPERLKAWAAEGLEAKIRKQSEGRSKFILHDGPPYANGHIHMGHAFNKILKDMIVKYKTMKGFDSYYIPGWDCHGLPIEHALFKELGKRKEEIEQFRFRKKARKYAEKYVSIQRDEFIRLGIFGDWKNPYLTMAPKYQSRIAESFLTLFERGYIEQRLKPVPWCFDCETALADAELEYEDKTSPSVFVAFEAIGKDFSFLVWTTTPWTLPGNVALALHPDLAYVLLETDKGKFMFAEALVDVVSEKVGFTKKKVSKKFKGKDLPDLKAKHPFIVRESRIVLADYVSSTDGTGIVHIAPGHGEEDYEVGLKYELPVLSPVDEKGRFTKEFKEAEGVVVHKANKKVIEILTNRKALLLHEPFSHSYPHCWRCKNPILFRATKQWFLKVDHENLRTKLQTAINEQIQFSPDWGKRRIGSMVETRPDWCLSRQRYWGVPIPIVRCKECDKILVTESKEKIVSMIGEKSADIWFEADANQFLPDGFKCACGKSSFEKEADIIDVWFDSGVSHQAVLKGAESLAYPANLYLEGSDQHRGWFQTSLITGVALDNHSPFEGVLTHGFVVDGEGKKMSKSKGNVVSPQEVMKQFGADALRLWVASSDYQFDVRLSEEILKRNAEGYRRIRNTFRFLLGNLYDFDYKKDSMEFEKMESVDRWALGKCLMMVEEVTGHYDRFAFHQIYRVVQDYLVVDLSSFYLDILKDRLYTARADSTKRRSAQTALYCILRNLVKVLAPILPFTCEEVWQSYNIQGGFQSVHEADWPKAYPEKIDKGLIRDWQDLLAIRDAVNQRIEAKREAKEIGSPLEAGLQLGTQDDRVHTLFRDYQTHLREALIVSHIDVSKNGVGEEVSLMLPSDGGSRVFHLVVEKAKGAKCSRCWTYSTHVGEDSSHPELCERCVEAIKT